MTGHDETWRAAEPFTNEREAIRAADRWRHVDVSPFDEDQWRQASARAHRQRLGEAVARTGIDTTPYEDAVLTDLTRLVMTADVEVVASLIERAYEAGARDMHDREGGAS